jgi:uncharacterized membrane protein
MSASSIFFESEKELIKQVIADAEKNTSGEIRVHIDNYCLGNSVRKAIRVFKRLKMYETAERNAVLIYVSIKNHKLAIVGDVGIDEKVPEGFWEDEKNLMIAHFKEGNYTSGLEEGIRLVGEQLKLYFPAIEGDKNELSDDISFGN